MGLCHAFALSPVAVAVAILVLLASTAPGRSLAESVDPRCREECRSHGRCSWEEDDTQTTPCHAASDDDCRRSADCKAKGECFEFHGGCFKKDFCAETHHCADEGRCTLSGGQCEIGGNADCRKSKGCREEGRCTRRGNACILANTADCKLTRQCETDDACTFIQGKCQTADEAVLARVSDVWDGMYAYMVVTEFAKNSECFRRTSLNNADHQRNRHAVCAVWKKALAAVASEERKESRDEVIENFCAQKATEPYGWLIHKRCDLNVSVSKEDCEADIRAMCPW